MLVRDRDGNTLMPRPLLNLATLNQSRGKREKHRIKGIVDPADYGINLPALVASEANLAAF